MTFKYIKAELGPSLARPVQKECQSHFVAVWLAYDLSIKHFASL